MQHIFHGQIVDAKFCIQHIILIVRNKTEQNFHSTVFFCGGKKRRKKKGQYEKNNSITAYQIFSINRIISYVLLFPLCLCTGCLQDPKTICQAIGFCNATKTESLLTAVPLGPAVGTVQIIAPEPKDRQSSPQCTICEFIMHKLEDMIGENATEVLRSWPCLPVLSVHACCWS